MTDLSFPRYQSQKIKILNASFSRVGSEHTAYRNYSCTFVPLSQRLATQNEYLIVLSRPRLQDDSGACSAGTIQRARAERDACRQRGHGVQAAAHAAARRRAARRRAPPVHQVADGVLL